MELVILHYTAETLSETLRLFSRRRDEAGAHLVIGEEGELFEIARCWEGTARSAPHAGKSRWLLSSRIRENLNDCSLGIELVNFNGNVIEYHEAQYETLERVIDHLRRKYPVLEDPGRILGHEHVAGWRGKVDPGAEFDWGRLFENLYPDQPAPDRSPACPFPLLEALRRFLPAEPADAEERAEYWRAVNYFLERTVGYINVPADSPE